jgi:hypothetical protein
MGAESSKLLLLEALPAVVGSLGAWWGVFIGRGRPEEGMGDRPFFGACCLCPAPFPLKKKNCESFLAPWAVEKHVPQQVVLRAWGRFRRLFSVY